MEGEEEEEMTEGDRGRQLTPVEEVMGVDYEGPCPICGLFHDDYCEMRLEQEEMKEIGQYKLREVMLKGLNSGFMIRNFFRPDAYQLLLWAIHGEWDELE